MNVSAQYDRDVARQVSGADHVWTESKREITWPAGRALDALVQAEHTYIGLQGFAVEGGQRFGKAPADVVRVRETHECGAYAACFDNESARSVKDMQTFVQRQQGKRNSAAFVVAG